MSHTVVVRVLIYLIFVFLPFTPSWGQEHPVPSADPAAPESKPPAPDGQKASPAPSKNPSAVGQEAVRETPAWHERHKKVKTDPPDSLPGTSALIFYTALVIGLIIVFFLILRRFSRSRLFGSGGVIRILSRKPLSQKQSLFLVEVGPKIYFIGATREDLVTLGVFSKKEDIGVIRAMCMSKSEESMVQVFDQQLRESVDSLAPEPQGESGPGGTESIYTSLEDIKKTVRGWKA